MGGCGQNRVKFPVPLYRTQIMARSRHRAILLLGFLVTIELRHHPIVAERKINRPASCFDFSRFSGAASKD